MLPSRFHTSAAASAAADGESKEEDAAAECVTDEHASLRKGGRHDTIVFLLAARGKFMSSNAGIGSVGGGGASV